MSTCGDRVQDMEMCIFGHFFQENAEATAGAGRSNKTGTLQ